MDDLRLYFGINHPSNLIFSSFYKNKWFLHFCSMVLSCDFVVQVRHYCIHRLSATFLFLVSLQCLLFVFKLALYVIFEMTKKNSLSRYHILSKILMCIVSIFFTFLLISKYELEMCQPMINFIALFSSFE